MIRAVMEGVMYRIKSVTDALSQVGQEPVEMRASGGFARSVLWRQMMADVLGTDVSVPESIESSGLGAAKLGLLALNEISELSELDHWVNIGARHKAHQEETKTYNELYPIYMNVYHQLKEPFSQISAYQRAAEKMT